MAFRSKTKIFCSKKSSLGKVFRKVQLFDNSEIMIDIFVLSIQKYERAKSYKQYFSCLLRDSFKHSIKILDHCALMCSDTENNLSYSQFLHLFKKRQPAPAGRQCWPGLDFAENCPLSRSNFNYSKSISCQFPSIPRE